MYLYLNVPIFNKVFSKYQWGFQTSFSTQQCLLAMLEKWEKPVNNEKVFRAFRALRVYRGLFDCLDHELLIAKLNVYGFSLPAVKLVHVYLSDRKQQTKNNSSCSGWHKILFGSILGSLLFNIFLIDLFFIIQDFDFAGYDNSNTPYLRVQVTWMEMLNSYKKPQLSYLNDPVII